MSDPSLSLIHTFDTERLTEWAVHVSSQSWEDITLAHVAAFLKDEEEPPPFFLHSDGHKGRDRDRGILQAVLRWMRDTFSVTADGGTCPSTSSLSPAGLALVLGAAPPRVASPLQLCLLLHALLTALGLRARLVYSLDPRPAAAAPAPAADRARDMQAEKRRRFDDNDSSDEEDTEHEQRAAEEDEEEDDEEEEGGAWAGTSLPVAAWVEVLLASTSSSSPSSSSSAATPTTGIVVENMEHATFGEGKTTDFCRNSSNISNSSSSGSSKREISVTSTAVSATWVNVDPIRNIVDNKALLEQTCRARRTSVCYVVAITPPAAFHDSDSDGDIMSRGSLLAATAPRGCSVQDVTFSYATNPSRTRQKRLKHKDDVEWWRSFQDSFSHSKHGGRSSSGTSSRRSENKSDAMSDRADAPTEDEDSVLDILPTSKSGFKGHPRYVLKPHLLDRQLLCAEAKPLGVFSGLLIYRRQDVLELKSKFEWSQLSRVVRDGESPMQLRDARRKGGTFKRTCPPSDVRGGVFCSSCSSVDHEGEAAADSTAQTLELYAESQTTAQPAPQLVDGAVPRNEHGNIALWGGDLSLVPQGAVYIKSKFASVAARELGIAAVEALVGFQTRLVFSQTLGQRVSRQVPVLEGVVVLQQVAELIEEAALTLEASAAQHRKEVSWKRICKKWHQLVHSLTLRDQLRQSYGA